MRWLLLLATLLLAACGDRAEGVPAAPPAREHLVELAPASLGNLAYAADRGGTLRALREVNIVNQADGEVLSVSVREGDRVRRGQVLVRYDERLLRAELDKAAATVRQAELDHRRNQQLQARGFVGAEALSRAATALEIARADERILQERLRYLTVIAPFDGVVSARQVEPGGVTPQHTHLMTLVDLSTLVTDVGVSELVLPLLSVGDPASVRIDALGDQGHAGRILRIHPAVDPVTRSGRVEVALDPVPAGARPGQYCRVELATGGRQQVLVPLAALRRDGEGEFVYVHEADGKVQRQAVQSGLRLADRVEIRAGLEAGRDVVTKGFIGLAPGKRVRPVAANGK